MKSPYPALPARWWPAAFLLTSSLLWVTSTMAAPGSPPPAKPASVGFSGQPGAEDTIKQPNGVIAVPLRLDKAGYVTLVVEDASGKRVRNLLAEQYFEAGQHTVYWDGLDEGTRILVPRSPGINRMQRSLVVPGKYQVRGLVRDALEMRYEFTAYPSGLKNVPWPTDIRQGTGGWLADHSAPAAAVYLPAAVTSTGKPQLLLGCGTAESSFGLAWVNEEGVKERGLWRLGGQWTGANFMARDRGPNAHKSIQAFAGIGWNNDKDKTRGEIRINVLTRSGDQTVLNYPIEADRTTGKRKVAVAEMRGMAVYDGLVVASLGDTNELLFVDAMAAPGAAANLNRRRTPGAPVLGKARGVLSYPGAGALEFDAQGRLYVVVGEQLRRYKLDRAAQPAALLGEEVLVKGGLQEAQRLLVADDGTIFVSVWGQKHQILVFGTDGTPRGAIGKAGVPRAGVFDPLQMTNPSGMALTESGQLWVTERNKIPKRVGVWNRQGQLLQSIYGPTKYGGGGTLDPRDATRFYYAEKEAAMELRLDWKTGTSQPSAIYWRPGPDEPALPQGWTGPQTPLYHGDRQYMTNSYNSSPTRGPLVAGLWRMQDSVARATVFVGDPAAWPLLATPEFRAVVPRELDLDKEGRDRRSGGLFIWTDGNENGQVEPSEFSFLLHDRADNLASVQFHDDLSVTLVRKRGVSRLVPARFTGSGLPVYPAQTSPLVQEMVEWVPTSGSGGEALVSADLAVVTGGPIQGFKAGKAWWSYTSQWPGLAAGHSSPRLPETNGQLLATTRLLGAPISVGQEQFWAINSDKGVLYLFTMDGLLVGTLGGYPTEVDGWRFAEAKRGMSVDKVNFLSESFWPTLNRRADGKVYLVVGKEHASLVALNGLESVRRLPGRELSVTAAQITLAAGQLEAKVQQKSLVAEPLRVVLRTEPPQVDGALSDWANATWVPIDAQTKATVAVAGERLYVTWKSDHLDLLENDGEDITTLFKSGGALDFWLGTDPGADKKRREPVAGDIRLLVTAAKGKTVAALYRAVVPGTTNPIPFSSPARTVTVDRVEDVSQMVQVASGLVREPNRWGRVLTSRAYEISIPLNVLGLLPREGLQLTGDIGILLGKNNETVARSYWHNKATGIVSDVPSEAEFSPDLWAEWRFQAQKAAVEPAKP